jgi:23S rRNA (uracil1939-C5)-methyltransferase
LNLFPSVTTLLFTINEKKNDSLFDLNPVHYSGKGYVIETLEDFKFKIGPNHSFRPTPTRAKKLYRVAREYAELTGNETVYDLYCGTGSIGIFVSGKAKKVIGVEMIKEAVDDAIEKRLA